jgi:RND superfamily putative drug exporter
MQDSTNRPAAGGDLPAAAGRLRGFTDLLIRRRRRILVITLVLGLAMLAVGAGAPRELKAGGFTDVTSPSQIAADRLAASGLGEPNLVLMVTPRSGSVDSASAAAFGRHLTAEVAATPGVEDVSSFWSTGQRTLESRNGREALLLAYVPGSDSHVQTLGDDLVRRFATAPQGDATSTVATVQAGGIIGTSHDTARQVAADLGKAGVIALPLTLILLVLAFGSVVAGLLPILIGLLAIAGSLFSLDILGRFTNISVYAENLIVALGLGLAIDYSLLIVNRFREHLAGGMGTAEAVHATLRTAGRTVLFSAVTVAAALSSLLVFPVYFLSSMAIAGVSVVLVAAIGATVVLPALLAALGPKVNAGRIRRRGGLDGAESRFWLSSTRAVLRRPAVSAVGVVVVLAVLAAPLLHIHFDIPNYRVLPSNSAARQVGDALQTDFPQNSSDTLAVVTTRPLSPAQTAAYAARLSSVAGVTAVQGPAGTFAAGHRVGPADATARRQPHGGTWLSVVSTADPESTAGTSQVGALRAVAVPGGVRADIGGQAAQLVDLEHALGGRLPLALGLLALITFVVLFLFTGSVFLPVKALILNAVSLMSVLGVVVWIFQEGHLSGLLGFTAGPTAITMPILLFVIAFGLSMDYEVFVLSRITELHDAGWSDTDAIAHGLARSGRIISTAAALMSVTFFAFGTSRLSFLQLFGVGTALAILIDATVVRSVLVPAVMRLAGSANWWAPTPLRRLHRSLGVSEGGGPVRGNGAAPAHLELSVD